ncbi:MAG: formimidoylglutamate deiminase, partial [Ktedonobacterales bacterium]|nr:formimidoylglutamate deiminase [Ktedonobacterales bacterium]
PNNPPIPEVQRVGRHLVMPGMATVHSHAFQRALRGRTQRRSTASATFWSWRGLMFALAERLNPDDLFNISRFAFVELAMSGVTSVGEFHYVHHDRGGKPYADRVQLAEAVIHAAKEAGIRITLIRAAYMRAGYQQEIVAGQERFCDANVDDILADTATLAQRYQADPLVRVTIAAHSIRAVPLKHIKTLASYARERQLPFHMHVAEQRRELAECEEEYGLTPVTLLAEHDLLNERFVAIHATHLTAKEIAAFGNAHATVGLCRTTERDLGDGTPQLDKLLQAGAQLSFGLDSHASSDAFEEMRAAELDMRPVTETRLVAAEAPTLLAAATQVGYSAIGFPDAWPHDHVRLNADDAALAGSDEHLLADAVVFGGTPRAVDEVEVNGQLIVKGGQHIRYAEALAGFQKTMNSGLLSQ